MRKRLQIQTRSTAQGTTGQQSRTWTNLVYVWAEIEALSSSEKLIAGTMQGSATHKITTRFRTELADPLKVGQMRAVYAGPAGVTRYFYFEPWTNEGERNRFIEMTAKEGFAAG